MQLVNAIPSTWKNNLKHSDTYSQNLILLDYHLVKSNSLFSIEKLEPREVYCIINFSHNNKQYSLSKWKKFCLWTFYNIILLHLQFFWWKYHTSFLWLYNNTMSLEKITVETERWYNSSSANTAGCYVRFSWSQLPVLSNPKPHSYFETEHVQV